MKSIKEKSKEFGILNPNIHYDADGNTYNDIDKPSTDFEEGADYVLDAIIECLPKTHSFNPNEAIDIITSRIKELKK